MIDTALCSQQERRWLYLLVSLFLLAISLMMTAFVSSFSSIKNAVYLLNNIRENETNDYNDRLGIIRINGDGLLSRSEGKTKAVNSQHER